MVGDFVKTDVGGRGDLLSVRGVAPGRGARERRLQHKELTSAQDDELNCVSHRLGAHHFCQLFGRTHGRPIHGDDDVVLLAALAILKLRRCGWAAGMDAYDLDSFRNRCRGRHALDTEPRAWWNGVRRSAAEELSQRFDGHAVRHRLTRRIGLVFCGLACAADHTQDPPLLIDQRRAQVRAGHPRRDLDGIAQDFAVSPEHLRSAFEHNGGYLYRAPTLGEGADAGALCERIGSRGEETVIPPAYLRHEQREIPNAIGVTHPHVDNGVVRVSGIDLVAITDGGQRCDDASVAREHEAEPDGAACAFEDDDPLSRVGEGVWLAFVFAGLGQGGWRGGLGRRGGGDEDRDEQESEGEVATKAHGASVARCAHGGRRGSGLGL